eukprot:scaffold6808_cov106-Isochrysis_galbana.AAC.1
MSQSQTRRVANGVRHTHNKAGGHSGDHWPLDRTRTYTYAAAPLCGPLRMRTNASHSRHMRGEQI